MGLFLLSKFNPFVSFIFIVLFTSLTIGTVFGFILTLSSIIGAVKFSEGLEITT